MFLVYGFETQQSTTLSLLGTIDVYVSYSYERIISSAGEFSLLLPYSKDVYELVSRSHNTDKFIQLGQDFLGVVEKVTIKTQVETKRIQIKGRHASHILSKYNIETSTAYGLPTEVIDAHFDVDLSTRIAQAQGVFSSEGVYHLPTFITFDLTKYQAYMYQTRLYMEANPIKGHSWFEYLQSGCDQNNLGFDMVMTSDGKLEIVLLFPLTKNNIIFHSQLQDFNGSEYTINSQSLYTLCRVNVNNVNYTDPSSPTGSSITSVSATARQSGMTSSENVGAVLKAYIMDVDGSGLNLSSISACEKYALGLAKSFLTKHKLVNVYATDIDLLQASYKLGEDYNLGDTVVIIDNNAGINLKAQVTSYVHSASSDGKVKIKPTFGYDQVTLSRLLTRNQII